MYESVTPHPPEIVSLPDFAAVERAAQRIAAHAARTPTLGSRSIGALAVATLVFKCENFQRAGAFKFRGACNAVWSLTDEVATRGVVTHSSGNHGAALALAARTRGIPAHVVVPEGAVKSKLAAIEAYGATLHFCAPTIVAREAAAAKLQAATGAELVHPYTDPRVIAGQGTAALELLREVSDLDALITPVGGGGLIGGSAIAAKALNPGIEIYGAEPAGADDAYQSLRRGARVTDIVPDTVCDGLRGTIGEINLALLRRHGVRVLTVDDAQTIAAQRLVFERMKIVIEPSSAIALAAVLGHPEIFRGRRVGVIFSGGNVDLDKLSWQ
ncbi:pyridoxal-phosphate dependent enzyme [Rudaea sp.]|uniref:pyridoxal-phosphate dependent enzyme n=1 Tax=Rudaea sp. TaxID=2136325 RepID=UPI002ED2980F